MKPPFHLLSWQKLMSPLRANFGVFASSICNDNFSISCITLECDRDVRLSSERREFMMSSEICMREFSEVPIRFATSSYPD
jgi:hypothetical protein